MDFFKDKFSNAHPTNLKQNANNGNKMFKNFLAFFASFDASFVLVMD